ncbi:hypothetical protein I5R65_18685 [Herbaspirillum sp. AP02]|uniref:hypothetical protein n=1 Tax=unclassified Herbaspirillum TaxID=2624150 RepID=UPI0015DAD624|nr:MULTISPECIES: hypothetical protein [unclassified Herbaspirillum]MBG7621499.1 hypothetical protein [Herbaspirillum sp. AP02]NZD69586.1 hypothetical protein [Herbaspirillum sp. AP21]
MKKILLLCASTCALLLSGCTAYPIAAYRDSAMMRASSADLTHSDAPLKLKMEVQWLMNGRAPDTNAQPMQITPPGPDPLMLRNALEAAFRQTGVIEISQNDAVGVVKVTLNDVSDIAEAINQGVRLGETWGDGHVTTKEEMTMSLAIRVGDKSAHSPAVRGAFYIMLAKSRLPDDPRLQPARSVQEDLFQQLLIKCLLALDKDGSLQRLQAP